MSKKVTKAKDAAFQKPDYELTIDQMNGLLRQVNDGNQAAFYRFRDLLWSDDDAWIADMLGDVADHARSALQKRIAGGQTGFLEALRTKTENLRTELEGPNPTLIEKLLVGRVLATWLQVSDADWSAARATEVSMRQDDHYQRRQDRAHKRFLSAVKMLAVVRRLALPIKVDLDVKASLTARHAEERAVNRGDFPALPTQSPKAIIDARPLLPGIADAPKQIDRLVRSVAGCGAEEVFAEAVNPRGNGLKVTEEALRAAGFVVEAAAVGAIRRTANWSPYVAGLIGNLQKSMRRHMTTDRLRFLLYPSNLAEQDETNIRKAGVGVVWL